MLLAGSLNQNPSRARSPDAGIADSRESPDIVTAGTALDHDNGTPISSDRSATGKDRLRLFRRDAFVQPPGRRPYLRRSSSHTALTGH